MRFFLICVLFYVLCCRWCFVCFCDLSFLFFYFCLGFFVFFLFCLLWCLWFLFLYLCDCFCLDFCGFFCLRFLLLYVLFCLFLNFRFLFSLVCFYLFFGCCFSMVCFSLSFGLLERECFDVFGLFFLGNDCLHRLFVDWFFCGFCFLKDFPLFGCFFFIFNFLVDDLLVLPTTNHVLLQKLFVHF